MGAANPKLRIASFGFRSFPPRDGAAGADKFALELLPRLAARGHEVVAYNRVYDRVDEGAVLNVAGVQVRTIRTFRRAGLEALWHSAKVTCDIIRYNRADVVHIQNGGNTPFGAALRLFGKRTILTEDGVEWERAKWPWYGKLYLRCMTYLTAFCHNQVAFDNVFARQQFEKKFGRRYAFIPYGADVADPADSQAVLSKFKLETGSYFLFVGRFIPDKGLHYLVNAFERLNTGRKLVMVGGAASGSAYADAIRSTSDARVHFPGYLYGSAVHSLMKNCYAYIQPSDIEGLSPVILESSFLGAPIICSDIEANKYVLGETGLYFQHGNADSLLRTLEQAERDPDALRRRGNAQREHIARTYSWDRVTDQYIELFAGSNNIDLTANPVTK